MTELFARSSYLIEGFHEWLPDSVAQSNARVTGDQKDAGLKHPGWHLSFEKIDHDLFFILFLHLIQINQYQFSVLLLFFFFAKECFDYWLTANTRHSY